MKTTKTLSFLLLILLSSLTIQAQDSYWKKSKLSSTSRTLTAKNLDKDQYQVFSLNLDAFKAQLSNAPLRTAVGSKSNVTISFPNQRGEMERFNVVEAPVLAPAIAAKHPNIKTYVGFSIDNPGSRVRFSVTPQGVQTMTSYPNKPTVFTVPTEKGNNTQYITYDRGVRVESEKDFECLTENEMVPIKETSSFSNRDANDQILRTFRIAISATGEYTNFWDDGNAANGDAQEDALAQVVSTLNRNNEVFEVDMAVTFQLVTGTEIIYASAGSDPYTGSFNSQLQSTLTSEVGEANYDIGHLFVFAGNNGNAGCIGCVCVDGQKGSGFSAHSFTDNDGGAYMNDFFDIDYVPHEIGHQMGGNHTWSFNSEGTGVNMEPGSGTTIMGYAGITNANDVQDHSDPYFHFASIDQILDNLETRTCWTSTAITNNPPVADAGNDHTIPQGTAFKLTGAATDADGSDVLTYTWEQIDNGITTNNTFGPTKTSGAVWRSRPPSTNPTRYMPILSRVMSGQLTETNPTETAGNTSWETVSTVGRSLNFALTVRDRSEANGTGQFPQSDFDFMTVTVDASSGPFAVTSQTTAEAWDAGDTQTVTWDVAGTDGGAVNTPTVNIRLSTDGGQTFPFVVATAVDNDGSHDIIVPVTGGDTSTARIMVEGNDNIFFAVNSSDFSIQESEFVISATNTSIEVCSPADAVYDLTYNTFLGFTDVTNFSTTGLPAGTSAVFSPASATADGTSVSLTVSGTGSLAPGNYTFNAVGTSGAITKQLILNFDVFSDTFAAPVLTSPSNGATGTTVDVPLTWDTDVNVVSYLVEISEDAGFSTILESSTVTTGMYVPTMLVINKDYYWRVTPSNNCGTGSPSAAFTFKTANLSCGDFESTDLPLTISGSMAGTYESVIDVSPNLPIVDINVEVGITHFFDGQLDIFLESPTGTVIELSTGNGSFNDNYTNTIFDQEASTSIVDGDAPYTGNFRPEGDLSTLYGTLTGGQWTLRVVDNVNFFGGSFDMFKLYFCVDGDILSTDNFNPVSNLSLYPNPSNGEFNLNFDTDGTDKVKLQLFDLAGRMVQEQNLTSAGARFSETISFKGLAKGLYLLKVVNGSKLSTKKLVIE